MPGRLALLHLLKSPVKRTLSSQESHLLPGLSGAPQGEQSLQGWSKGLTASPARMKRYQVRILSPGGPEHMKATYTRAQYPLDVPVLHESYALQSYW